MEAPPTFRCIVLCKAPGTRGSVLAFAGIGASRILPSFRWSLPRHRNCDQFRSNEHANRARFLWSGIRKNSKAEGAALNGAKLSAVFDPSQDRLARTLALQNQLSTIWSKVYSSPHPTPLRRLPILPIGDKTLTPIDADQTADPEDAFAPANRSSVFALFLRRPPLSSRCARQCHLIHGPRAGRLQCFAPLLDLLETRRPRHALPAAQAPTSLRVFV
jgi:hypothetical protein